MRVSKNEIRPIPIGSYRKAASLHFQDGLEFHEAKRSGMISLQDLKRNVDKNKRRFDVGLDLISPYSEFYRRLVDRFLLLLFLQCAYGLSVPIVGDLSIQINKNPNCDKNKKWLKHTTEQFEPFRQYVLTPAICNKLRDRDDNP